jgi:NADP-dependent 3-hydroxy acid dehydrogenase YdfG
VQLQRQRLLHSEGTSLTRLHRRAFSKAGYSVALIARGQNSLNALSEEIKSNGGDVGTLRVDLVFLISSC